MSMPDRSIRAMRAAVLDSHGAVPELGEFRDPKPDDGAVLLDVLAAAMNPVDIRIASGTFPNERHEPPYVAGKEGVGRRGDGGLVYFDHSREPFGAFAERTLIDEGSGYPVPEGLDPALAVSLGVSGLAAWLALEWRGALAPGETVLILGASGVAGQIGVQAAKLLGAGRVVAAARNPEGLERARRLGADAAVSLEEEDDDLAGAFREASGGDGFDLVSDALWGQPALAALAALRPFGRMAHFGQSAGAEVSIPSTAIRAKPVEIVGYSNYSAPDEVKARAYERMAEHAAAGELTVEIERLGLDDVPDAWRRQTSSPGRKLVFIP
jgi:NADPH:quinone reductase-like Zn-dependent oxidoreductase